MLISPNLVLTCAHNICNKRTGDYYIKFKFYPGQAGLLDHPLDVEEVFFPREYLDSSNILYDYALLKLYSRI